MANIGMMVVARLPERREIMKRGHQCAALFFALLINEPRTAIAQDSPPAQRWLPVSLKCPSENGGILEAISEEMERTRGEYRQRNRVKGTVENDRCNRIIVGYDDGTLNGKFKDFLDSLSGENYEPERRQTISDARERCEILLRKVCMGTSEYRQKYYDMLRANLLKLR